MEQYSDFATSKKWMKDDEIVNAILLIPTEIISSRSETIIPIPKVYSEQFPKKFDINIQSHVEAKKNSKNN